MNTPTIPEQGLPIEEQLARAAKALVNANERIADLEAERDGLQEDVASLKAQMAEAAAVSKDATDEPPAEGDDDDSLMQ